VRVEAIYLSVGHNFFGHHGREADNHPMQPVEQVLAVAGMGLTGDRFFNYKEDYKGQITFLADELYQELVISLPVTTAGSAARLRRNVITQGVDLNQWIGQEFEIQGVRFFGTEACKPCHWMNDALGAGAEDWLQGRAGLRAKILTSGYLQRDS
jgi:MOSC domain-containing protein YiiM